MQRSRSKGRKLEQKLKRIRHKYFFLILFLLSQLRFRLQVFSFCPILIVQENVCIPRLCENVRPIHLKIKQKNLEIKLRKLRISRKLCWRSTLCNLGCSKKSTKNKLVNQVGTSEKRVLTFGLRPNLITKLNGWCAND